MNMKTLNVSGIRGLALSVISLSLMACAQDPSEQEPVPSLIDANGYTEYACVAPIISLSSNEKEIKLKDLVTGEPGAYVLSSVEYYSNYANPRSHNDYLHWTDNNANGDWLNVSELCHTSALESNTRISGQTDFPDSISTVDGSTTSYRKNKLVVDGGRVVEYSSVLYPRSASVSDSEGPLPSGTEALVVQNTQTGEVIMKIKLSQHSSLRQSAITIIVKAKYKKQN